MTFKQGQSGNPRGRPKRGQSFADALRSALKERDPQTKQTALTRVADAAVRKALAGDMGAIAFIAERLDGKVPDEIETSGGLQIVVTYADDRTHAS